MIKLKNILLEIGEGSAKPYKFELEKDKPDDTDHSREVSFKTEDGDDYKVMLAAYWGDTTITDTFGSHISIDFYIYHGFGTHDADVVVNKGRLFKVMATIVKATEEFLNDIDYKEKGIKKMFVFPSKSKKSDHRRANLYMAYIKKHLPTSNIKYNGQIITVTLR